MINNHLLSEKKHKTSAKKSYSQVNIPNQNNDGQADYEHPNSFQKLHPEYRSSIKSD